MREITKHQINECNEQLEIHVMDEPGAGGASSQYRLLVKPLNSPQFFVDIPFQNGPILEVGTNGITHEALLAILEDRLIGFQSGKFACDDNVIALDHIHMAQMVLKARTLKRLAAGVEGTHQVTPENQNQASPPPIEPIMQFFAYQHLPPKLQEVSRPFGIIANLIVTTLPRNAERTVALRKLLESKDAAVRAQLAK